MGGILNILATKLQSYLHIIWHYLVKSYQYKSGSGMLYRTVVYTDSIILIHGGFKYEVYQTSQDATD